MSSPRSGMGPRVLVWQWGRRGAGPRYAAELAAALEQAGAPTLLSLSAGAELLRSQTPPACALPVRTYRTLPGFLLRWLATPFLVPRIARWLRRNQVDIAVCAMPAALDLVMAAALRWAGIPFAVVVHEVDLHPGDRFASQLRLQRWLIRRAALLFALSGHVAERIRAQGLDERRKLEQATLPPFRYGTEFPQVGSHGGKLRLLSFGRLLPYKGLDLLADALALLGVRASDGPPGPELEVRVVGSGPDSAELHRLQAMQGVRVENRWVAEDAIAGLLGWADALILSHREASQSGVAAAAIAARRWVVATEVGGLAEQLRGEPAARLCRPDAASLADALRALIAAHPAVPPAPLATEAAWREGVARMRDALLDATGYSSR